MNAFPTLRRSIVLSIIKLLSIDQVMKIVNYIRAPTVQGLTRGF